MSYKFVIHNNCINFQKYNELRKKNPAVYKNNHIGMYAWKLDKMIRYDKDIIVNGKLGLWNYEK